MSDPELEQLRKQRLAQLQSQYKPSEGQGDLKAQEEQQARAQDAKNSILSQILDQSARARLNTLMMAKPEKGRMVEGMLLRMAQTGQLRGKITENELIELLENVNQQVGSSNAKVKFDRRRAALDSDDDI